MLKSFRPTVELLGTNTKYLSKCLPTELENEKILLQMHYIIGNNRTRTNKMLIKQKTVESVTEKI